MIRIKIDSKRLEKMISKEDAGWIQNAKDKTKELELNTTLKIENIWRPIKKAFMDLQYSKCIYCEKKIEKNKYEQDVEHFRPKNRADSWVASKSLIEEEKILIKNPTSGSEPGYRLLAYNYFNYAASCKACNLDRKKCFFPIAGKVRMNHSKNPARMKSENSYLIYPISDLDEDPEKLIEFEGVLPKAKASNGFSRKRALVTIELFELDKRSFLLRERAEMLYWLFKALKQYDDGNSAEKKEAQIIVQEYTSGAEKHTNCMRCFKKLYRKNFSEAESIAKKAFAFWKSKSC
ncbi:hypothetical protein [Gimesia sp.]|uniref:hypothetical protein n=1 Tax=Gimesia sp. TaxID=2024833 RepID=UPI0032EF13B8